MPATKIEYYQHAPARDHYIPAAFFSHPTEGSYPHIATAILDYLWDAPDGMSGLAPLRGTNKAFREAIDSILFKNAEIIGRDTEARSMGDFTIRAVNGPHLRLCVSSCPSELANHSLIHESFNKYTKLVDIKGTFPDPKLITWHSAIPTLSAEYFNIPVARYASDLVLHSAIGGVGSDKRIVEINWFDKKDFDLWPVNAFDQPFPKAITFVINFHLTVTNMALRPFGMRTRTPGLPPLSDGRLAAITFIIKFQPLPTDGSVPPVYGAIALSMARRLVDLLATFIAPNVYVAGRKFTIVGLQPLEDHCCVTTARMSGWPSSPLSNIAFATTTWDQLAVAKSVVRAGRLRGLRLLKSLVSPKISLLGHQEYFEKVGPEEYALEMSGATEPFTHEDTVMRTKDGQWVIGGIVAN
ncbi:hypothetical protein Q8F55_007422 [Vanrija albida]|uniref:Uncharacterized protein n=1 Tax=Vanrija albida TaxID=181172 RepID=A0ABR3PTH2_9TREE